jgi:hypothetical protein
MGKKVDKSKEAIFMMVKDRLDEGKIVIAGELAAEFGKSSDEILMILSRLDEKY